MKMKNILFTGLLGLCTFTGCDYLDFDESVGYEKEDIFSVFVRAKSMLTHVYSFLPSDLGGGAMLDAATDDAIYVWPTSSIHIFTNGSWSSINTIDDQWGNLYAGIRAANIFLESYQGDFPDNQYNVDYEEQMKQYRYYPYEARFLRAFFYFELIKRYKNVPLVEKTLEIEDVNELLQTDYEVMTDFISSECDAIKDHLPVNYNDVPGKEVGRITKGAVLALKSRVLLYAASPLHNPTNDKEKWLKAAKAAKELIDLSEAGGWYQIINEEVVNNPDAKGLILQRMEGNSNVFESTNFPVGYEGGNTGMCPSENLMEAFEMIDGTTFDFNNPKHVESMYDVNSRDPRLFKTMLYNGATWKGETVESYQGGKNGYPRNGASKTSYYLKKYLKESVNLTTGSATSERHVWVIFRYAEIFLNYAEALNEAYGPEYTGGEFSLSAKDALNKIRQRVGMPLLTSLSQDAFREKVRNERRVEFAFEGQRFWDIRRWKIGDRTNVIYGLEIEKGVDGAFEYKRVLVEPRKWEDKMYIYPIANTERFKNVNLVQNPGW
ncbi:RagB/SusD family nutrient uptake outer membrane protein [Parabacteroides faecis]|jgi:SusD family.|uniref:RagB/SusD family nutrient uptake outer membrane protein n=3 Tax=Tannerellaceae TaxID=2005525 RepID=UPI000F002CA1|nr:MULTISPECIES: RagB/SusD family nutrient uptake outer membrane protein [Parabacteroides]MBC8618618.1 RagB/SusD family nutrient uptake outer membrane protein [Parabacteroides faecis]RHR38222.1 RagB/SusD family nutrient uptake outer membrane protein [Parabacteroides sp. AF18-52]RHR97860.1 RagB/SusD family nutrient uptake outer membrane protein [Parabacteroides sp. AF14-59]